ncbi:ATP-binding protein [Embleya hyalina]|uniref:ATPase n=1 Tax=Embleya hyalina TaxID=516124 RepID=A0A401Z352_9ACTN|nr:ATP-binding protein [Embleya hyalina]GCE01250.1 ATPase [Embleya hyalina]
MTRLRRSLFRWRLPRQTGAAGRARDEVRAALAGWGWDEDRVATAVLVVSELSTNARLHTDGPIGLAVRRTRHGARLSVTDTDPRPPTRRDTGPRQEGGFGLHILDTIASRWGVRTHRAGKTVWADVDARDPAPRSRPAHAPTTGPAAAGQRPAGPPRRPRDHGAAAPRDPGILQGGSDRGRTCDPVSRWRTTALSATRSDR